MHVSEADYKKLAVLLKENNIAFTIQLFDVQDALNMELDGRASRAGSWYSQYHTLEEVCSHAESSNPDVLVTVRMGD